MTKRINIQAAKTHLSRLVERAARGEEIVIAKSGKPLAKLVPFRASKKARLGGQLHGQIWESPDCWARDQVLIQQMMATPLYPAAAAQTPAHVAEHETAP